HDQLLFLMRPALLLLLAVSSAVLFLCCASVVALGLLRSSARTREIAVRASMGASRGRLVSVLLAVSLVLALPPALISLLVAWLIARGLGRVPGLPASPSSSMPGAVSDVRVNTAAVLVAIGVAVASVLAAGVLA